jgi:hypothetical protein
METFDLTRLLSAMSVDAINVQLRLDRHYEEEIRHFADLPGAASELLRPLFPRRLCLERFDPSFRAGIVVTHEHEFAIRAVPLNAQIFKRTSATTGRYSRLSFSVHPVPVSKEESPWQ